MWVHVLIERFLDFDVAHKDEVALFEVKIADYLFV